jgi:hypothetical protein
MLVPIKCRPNLGAAAANIQTGRGPCASLAVAEASCELMSAMGGKRTFEQLEQRHALKGDNHSRTGQSAPLQTAAELSDKI